MELDVWNTAWKFQRFVKDRSALVLARALDIKRGKKRAKIEVCTEQPIQRTEESGMSSISLLTKCDAVYFFFKRHFSFVDIKYGNKK